MPDRVSEPAPDLVKAKLPLIAPLMAMLLAPPIVLLPVMVTVPVCVALLALLLINAPALVLRVLPEPAIEIFGEVDWPFKSIKPPLVTVIAP